VHYLEVLVYLEMVSLRITLLTQVKKEGMETLQSEASNLDPGKNGEMIICPG